MVHVWENRRLDIIILRLEDHDRWDEILLPFFPKVKSFAATNQGANNGATVYVAKYKELLSTLSYTDEEIKRMSQAKAFLHFYTREEQDKFVNGARDLSLRLAGILNEDVEDDHRYLQLPGC